MMTPERYVAHDPDWRGNLAAWRREWEKIHPGLRFLIGLFAFEVFMLGLILGTVLGVVLS